MIEQIQDKSARNEALDIRHSYIIQAPAGSGKTSLLTARLLALLANVGEPEEILAITFTRKAAAEMRGRIIAALALIGTPKPEKEYEQQLWSLANALTDKAKAWALIENPGRLRILTIDAFCARLTRAMPMTSGIGALPNILDDASECYIDAARAVLARLEHDDRWSEAIANFLLHVDNNLARATNLLADMLATREAWLPYLSHAENTEQFKRLLEQGLQNLCTHTLGIAHRLFPADYRLAFSDILSSVAKALDFNYSPAAFLESPTYRCLALWQQIAKLCLTQSGSLRKTVSKKEGFPAPSSIKDKAQAAEASANKQAMQTFLAYCHQHPEFGDALADVAALPNPRYDHTQWRLIKALSDILPLACAHCQLAFAARDACDYTELSQRASQALGEITEPTDLALALDYQIQHILIDEFQDTAKTQFRLLEKLIAGWQTGDGRTLFLVGDPMQSIYRFRGAEVGLFLRVKNQGIGDIQLRSLLLTSNFRSQEKIIRWVNDIFTDLFPQQEDITLGRIPYARASALVSSTPHCQIAYHPHLSPAAGANKIVSLIKGYQNESLSIAILVQARTHLFEIIPALMQAGIPYVATEIESLLENPLIQDLLTLTEALLFPADRIAWLGCLRAPWCGLSCDDLVALAGEKQSQTLLQRCKDLSTLPLSETGKHRVTRLMSVLSQSLAERGRKSFRVWVESTWLAIGGPACLSDPASLNVAEQYFSVLEDFPESGKPISIHDIQKRLGKVASPGTRAAAQVEIMTIHKAKGLEFDIVILPGLEKKCRNDDTRLLLWHELTTQFGDTLVAAPMRHSHDDADQIYQFLRRGENTKSQTEQIRLFYVACTRAKVALHLVGCLRPDQKSSSGYATPKQSLLAHLWPLIHQDFCANLQEEQARTLDLQAKQTDERPYYRLTPNWRLPASCAPGLTLSPNQRNQIRIAFVKETMHNKVVGTAIHKMLYSLSLQDQADWRPSQTDIRQCLQDLGLNDTLDEACEIVERAIQNTLACPRGQWILNAHPEAESEYAITTMTASGTKNYVIDRTFVDESNVRWIIDYKLAKPEITEEFRAQLQAYQEAMKGLDKRPSKLALYFPLSSTWLPL